MMPQANQARRTLILAGVAFAAGASGMLSPARAQGLAPTPTMRRGTTTTGPARRS